MQRLTGIGVWSHHLRYGDATRIEELAKGLDELGYDALWIPDVGGDVLGSMELLLQATDRCVIATGILNIWMHDPLEVAARRASWNDAWRRRALFGLGVSHEVLINHEHPGRYARPYTKMVEYLDELDRAPVPLPADARVLAALRPRMLGLARDRAAGAFPYFVPVDHVAHAREVVGDDGMIAAELAVVLDRDAASARSAARGYAATYLGLPNYTNNLRDFGFSDDDFANGGSDRLIDALVAWGTVDAVADRVRAMRAAGADHVCVQVIRSDAEPPVDEWRDLASALMTL